MQNQFKQKSSHGFDKQKFANDLLEYMACHNAVAYNIGAMLEHDEISLDDVSKKYQPALVEKTKGYAFEVYTQDPSLCEEGMDAQQCADKFWILFVTDVIVQSYSIVIDVQASDVEGFIGLPASFSKKEADEFHENIVQSMKSLCDLGRGVLGLSKDSIDDQEFLNVSRFAMMHELDEQGKPFTTWFKNARMLYSCDSNQKHIL